MDGRATWSTALWTGALVVSLAFTPAAFAQDEASDVVRLHDGSFVRGMLVERIEGDHVTIRSLTGELRTFPMADVAYAGAFPEPTAPEPEVTAPPSLPAPPSDPYLHRIGVTSDQPGLQLFVVTPTELSLHSDRFEVGSLVQYELLCEAPCVLHLEPGRRELALGVEDSRPLVVGPIEIRSDAMLSIHLDDRSGWRGLGAALLFAGGVPGLIFLSFALATALDAPLDPGFAAVGVAFTAVGIAGIPLVAWGDTRTIELVEE